MSNAAKYFDEYLKRSILTDSAYDCSDIADDFYDKLKTGKVLKIYTTDKVGVAIKIPENGVEQLYVNHYVYSDGTYVYDPRYKKERVRENEYLEQLQTINSVKLLVAIDRE